MAVINLTTKYSKRIDERFKLKSVTDAYAGDAYDWDGSKSIKIYSIDKVGINDYSRTANANRFGTATELGDTTQTMTLTQDKSATFIIDRGNAADQMNIKECNRKLKEIWDEEATPEIDMYRLDKWANGAGTVNIDATELTKDTIVEAIVAANTALSNHKVPRNDRVCFIGETNYAKTLLSSEFIAVEKLGEKALANGVVGKIGAACIVPVPDDYLPAGVTFIMKFKGATADPMKLKTLRVQENPVGIDGDVGELRFYHDAFVLGNKADGIYVHASAATALPTASISSNAVTLTCAGATIKYTTDGTNPKNSDTAKVYSSAISITEDTTIKAYAEKDGVINSGIMTYEAKYSA